MNPNKIKKNLSEKEIRKFKFGYLTSQNDSLVKSLQKPGGSNSLK